MPYIVLQKKTTYLLRRITLVMYSLAKRRVYSNISLAMEEAYATS